jgi:hypothetical protein
VPNHIWPSNSMDDGDPSTALGFSRTMRPEIVADIVVWRV